MSTVGGNDTDTFAKQVFPVPANKEALESAAAPEDKDLPGYYVCWYSSKTPERGVYLNIPGADGKLSPQVFEYNEVYRAISITGVYAQFRKLCHPALGGDDKESGRLHSFVDCRRALELVGGVPSEVQAVRTRER